MKILFVQKEGGIFGAENYHLKTIPALIKSGIHIEFLRLYTDYQGGKGGNFVERLSSERIPVYEINIGRFPTLTKVQRIKKIIESGEYDLVHTHLIHADLYVSLVKLFFGLACKWVSTKHGYDNKFTSKHGFDASKQGITPYYLIARLSETLVDRSFTISNGLRNFFLKTKLAKEDKMGLIHYGFDYEPPTYDWKDTRYRQFSKQVFIAGRLVPFKGHKYLVDALPKVLRKHPDAGLLIAGSGEGEEDITKQVNQLGINESVVMLGYTGAVVKYMYNSDVVVVPSISEGFGVVFLEAFNCSKPVVAFDVPAGNEIIENGTSGYLAEPYSSRELAEKIIHIFDHPLEAQQAGERANEKLLSYFNLNRMIEQTIDFYKRVL